MGYRTQYSLAAPVAHYAQIHAALSALADKYAQTSPFVEDKQTAAGDDYACKWYSCVADCDEVSKMFPGVGFAVFHRGEDQYEWTRVDYHTPDGGANPAL